MNEDLQFAALHSDDALLDALGARTPGAALGVAAGVDLSASDDAAARLLGAFAREIDTRPGPLAHLLDPNAAPAPARTERPFTAVEETSIAPLAARRRRRAVPRIAAAAAAGVLVVGLGGVAAAVGGAAPLETLRRAVGAAPEATPTLSTAAAQASSLLASAGKALDAGDLPLAADRFGRAQDLYFQIQDTAAARTLRAKIADFRARWETVVAPVAGVLAKGEGSSSKSTAPVLPALRQPKASEPAAKPLPEPNYQLPGPEAKEQLVPEAGMDDPSCNVSLPDEGLEDEKCDRLEGAKTGLNEAKDQLKDKAAEKLKPRRSDPAPTKPLPGDLPGPSRGPLDGLGPEGLFGR
ncbi:MAG: hypothetical protein ACT4QF_06215 [Sporichthyaceae bacterium]